MFGSHESRSPKGERESIHSNTSPDKESFTDAFKSFFAMFLGKEKEKEREGEKDRRRPIDVSDRSQWNMFHLIGWVTSNGVEDWGIVAELCEKVNASNSVANEASAGLRSDIQLGRPSSQLAAAKLWAILMINCDRYFVAQTTDQKFLSTIEEVALDPNTSPVVRDRLVEVVGMSVYQLRDSEHLKPYQATWNKLRTQLELIHPTEGLKLDPDDPILIPTPRRASASHRRNPIGESSQPELATGVAAIAQHMADAGMQPAGEQREMREEGREHRRESSHQGETTYTITSLEEDRRRLLEECEIAHDYCRNLEESLIYATPESVTEEPSIQEFRQKCIKSQEMIGAQLDWATTIADRAHAEQLVLVGPGKVAPTTVEEQLLHTLVTVNKELNNVLKTYDDLERMALSEHEERPKGPDRHASIINSTMTPAAIAQVLGNHGCTNLTDALDLQSSSDYSVSSGGFGDVFSGKLKSGTPVAIKVPRLHIIHRQDGKHLKHAAKELHTWSKCRHPNVLQLLGMAEFRGQIAMVSPWIKNGSVRDYISRQPNVDRYQLCYGIADGLAYLHGINIVHGDLKGANVLISDDGLPVLTDFGNSVFQDCSVQFSRSTVKQDFSLRWTAPEALTGTVAYSYKADVFSLGMTLLETITGEVPYSQLRREAAVITAILGARVPERPKTHIPTSSAQGDKLWSLLISCWARDPEARPSAMEASDLMRTITRNGLVNLP